jgi:hypothetical protein
MISGILSFNIFGECHARYLNDAADEYLASAALIWVNTLFLRRDNILCPAQHQGEIVCVN